MELDDESRWTKMLASSKWAGECLEWQMARNRAGYGVTNHRKKKWLAHRLAHALQAGQIPEGLNVLHTCDNPPCINPDHLWAGTQKDNMQDKMRKGRAGAAKGPDSAHSKLTLDQVIEIRRLHSEEGIGSRILCRRYSMSRSAIRQILSRQTWRFD